MSTRCQIGFYEEETKKLGNWVSLIYRHSDGYPDGENGVVAIIEPFLKWFKAERGHDPEYGCARLLQYLCNEYDNHSREMAMLCNHKNNFGIVGTLGHGICKDFHGDIEYYYAIFPNKIEVYATHYEDNQAKWTIEQTIDLNS